MKMRLYGFIMNDLVKLDYTYMSVVSLTAL